MEQKTHSLKFNAILNVIKQLCSMVFPLITFPFATRTLGKFYYGKINFGSSIISYIALIANLGISSYAIREGCKVRPDKDKLQGLCNEIFSISVISTVVAYVVLFILILFWKRLNGYALLLLIQSLTVLFATLGTDWINSIFEDYLYQTIRYIGCQGLSIILMLSIVNGPEDYLLYAFASVSSTVLANICNIFYIRKQYGLKIRFTEKMDMKRHIQPILILFGMAIASTIYINSDITMLGVIKDENEVALYSVSAKIYSLVKQLLNAMLIVAIPRVSYDIAHNTQELINKELSDVLESLLLLMIPTCIGIYMLSDEVILLLSGREYLEASSSLKVLSGALFFACMACFFITVVLIPYNGEKTAFIATIISAAANIILNFILIPSRGQNAAAFTTMISEAIMSIMGMYATRKMISLHVNKSIWISIFTGTATFLICFLMRSLNLAALWTIILSIVVSILFFMIILYIGYRKKYDYFVGQMLHKVKH